MKYAVRLSRKGIAKVKRKIVFCKYFFEIFQIVFILISLAQPYSILLSCCLGVLFEHYRRFKPKAKVSFCQFTVLFSLRTNTFMLIESLVYIKP